MFVALFIRLGLWQLHKAEARQALQAQLEQRRTEAPTMLPAQIDKLEDWRYRRVKLVGTYDTRYQILLDNQIENGAAGYHVITPLRIDNSDLYVLVNRGWIPAPADHSVVPQVDTPAGQQHLTGSVWLPSDKIFALQAPPASAQWQPVWQNLDLKRYRETAPISILPLVVRLDPTSNGGGFVRNWPAPAERIETNLGYAYQWFGFAATLVVIYLVLSFRKVEQV